MLIFAVGCGSSCASNTKESGTSYEKAMDQYVKKTYYGMLLSQSDEGKDRLDELSKCWAKETQPLLDEKTQAAFIKDANNPKATKDLEYDYGFDGDEMSEVLGHCTKDLDEQFDE